MEFLHLMPISFIWGPCPPPPLICLRVNHRKPRFTSSPIGLLLGRCLASNPKPLSKAEAQHLTIGLPQADRLYQSRFWPDPSRLTITLKITGRHTVQSPGLLVRRPGTKRTTFIYTTHLHAWGHVYRRMPMTRPLPRLLLGRSWVCNLVEGKPILV
ncbi:hypothetical protein Fmac_013011 [Flemingia macrophylla]|uniref:Uncharacterized protein n=1 Tax=Flemingia macrophylla TaxID=520843 RepID=A0ABD1MRX7_9FABA